MPLSSSMRAAVLKLSSSSPRVLASYAYGTAGFRGLASTLDSVNLRMGMLAAIRSWAKHKQATTDAPSAASAGAHGHSAAAASSSSASAAVCPIVGVMVTASHNAECDNGLKLVDPSGEMLEQSWESVAGSLANAAEADLADCIDGIISKFGLESYLASGSPLARIFVGRDTRVSSPHLCNLVVAGAKSLGGEVVEYGLLTTPQLHWVVREANQGRDATVQAYYAQLARAFKTALACKWNHSNAGPHPAIDADSTASPGSASAPAAAHHAPTHASSITLSPLVVDCANGVGSQSLGVVAGLLKDSLAIDLRNTRTDGGLNDHCGAEHVQKTRSLPLGFAVDSDRGKKLASVDGDADRLVYFFVGGGGSGEGQFRLLDGDKTLCLYTLFLQDLLRASGLGSDLSLGIVQTAYANGASSIFVREKLGLQVQFANTGVKYLHHKALEYDVGVYFEANGHGTVIFSTKAIEAIKKAAHNTQQTPEKHTAARCLAALIDLINQCIGDALSDLLLVEVALYHRGWSLSDWDGMYEDLPSSMLKVCVLDRGVISTTDAERRCVTPAGLQDAIDELVNAGPGGVAGVRRAFVRPSGTEDIVRVYAEAATREEVDKLANDVCAAVARLAGGI